MDVKVKNLIEELQQRWKCATHTKGTDAYCYQPSGGSVCFPISHSNLRFWALEIVCLLFISVHIYANNLAI